MNYGKIFWLKLSIIKNIFLFRNKETLNWIQFILNYNDFKEELKFDKDILKKGNVVWLNFGSNIGSEFSGLHPAVILNSNLNSKTVCVIPIDTGTCDDKLGYCVALPRIYGFKDRKRYVNVYRVQWLSISRIDFDNRIGHIDTLVLKNIYETIKKSCFGLDKI